MNATLKKILIVLVFTALAIPLLWLVRAEPQTGGGTGPDTRSFPQVTATTCPAATPIAAGATKLIGQSVIGTKESGLYGISDRLCYTVTNYSTTIPVQVGEWISATQGYTLNVVPAAQPTGSAGGSITVCATSEVDACGIGGSAVVGVESLRRQ